MKRAKTKAKKSINKAAKKSAGQIAASRIGFPGVKMFRLDQLRPAGYNPRVIAAEAMKAWTEAEKAKVRLTEIEHTVPFEIRKKDVLFKENTSLTFEEIRQLALQLH